jgi:hypothetical protein
MDENDYLNVNTKFLGVNNSKLVNNYISENPSDNEFKLSDGELINPNISKESINKSKNNYVSTEDKFNEFIKGEDYVNLIIVDSKSNGFNTIQKAIDAAKPYTTIKVKPGIYRENLVISTPYLDIESEDSVQQAIVISTNKPTIRIEGIQQKESIRIANMKLTNRGIVKEKESDNDLTKL